MVQPTVSPYILVTIHSPVLIRGYVASSDPGEPLASLIQAWCTIHFDSFQV